jgi:hypothetical protein
MKHFLKNFKVINFVLILTLFNLNAKAKFQSDSVSFKNKIDFDKLDLYIVNKNIEHVIIEDTSFRIIPEENYYDRIEITGEIGIDKSIRNVPRYTKKVHAYIKEYIKDTSTIAVSKCHYYKATSIKLKINTLAGIDMLTQSIQNLNDLFSIKYINIEDVKSNGKIVNIEGNLFLKRFVLNNNIQYQQDSTRNNVFGIDVGDTISINYISNYSQYNNYESSGKLFFFSNLPSLQSNYKFVIPLSHQFKYKCYNHLNQQIILTDSLSTTIQFRTDSVDVIYDNLNGCLADELPFFQYSINYNNKQPYNILKQYTDFFSFTNTPFYLQLPEDDARWINKNLESYSISDKFLKFYFLHNLVFKNYEITKDSSFFDYNNKTISENNLPKLYVHLLNCLKIDFYLCLTKTKYLGKIDLEAINKGEFENFMLMFYDNDSNKIFIYPNELGKKYYVNEYPEYLNGTNIIAVKQKNKTEIKKSIMNSSKCTDISQLEIKPILLKRADESTNYIKRSDLINISLNKDVSTYVSSQDFSGFEATKNRNIYRNILKNDETFQLFKSKNNIDNLVMQKSDNYFPYKCSIKKSGKYPNEIYTYLNDSTIVISLKDIINNSIIEIKKNRNLNVIIPSAYTDLHSLTINFPKQIYVLNIDSLRKQVDNNIGLYKFDISNAENKLVLTSLYVIKKDFISKKNFESLNSINDMINQVLDSKIVVVMKK